MKKILFLILALCMITSFAMSQDQLPKKGNDYITFGYTPFQSDVKAIVTAQDTSGLVTVGYGKYLQDNLKVEGLLGIASHKNYLSYAIGGNAYFNLKSYNRVVPYLVAGAMFTGINNTDNSGTLKSNVLTLNTGLGVEYFINSNLSLNASYKLNFEYWMKPTHSQMELINPEEKFILRTGIGKIAINIYW